MATQAKDLSEAKGLKTREYFICDPSEIGYLFCVFCLVQGARHKYAKSTSPTNLRRHLMLKHNVDPQNPDMGPVDDNFEDETNDFPSDDDGMLQEEENPSSLRNPVHRIMFRIPVTPQIHNTKYCRSCGNYDVSFFSKFSSNFRINDEDPDLTLGEVYAEITGVQIYPDDGMSQSICYPCEANLKTAYHFKTLAAKTEDQMIQKFSIDQPIEIPTTSIKCEIDIDDDSDDDAERMDKRSRAQRHKKIVDYQEEYLEDA